MLKSKNKLKQNIFICITLLLIFIAAFITGYYASKFHG